MKLNVLFLLLGILVLGSPAKAQLSLELTQSDTYHNFVPNHSFEETERLYCKWNQNGRKYMEHVVAWDSPTETTPDIFSLKSKPTCWSNPRKHSDGKQSPRNGDNMAGIKTHGKGGTETFWHEYLMVELDSVLIPGERYYAEFYASRAVACERATNNLGILFSDTALITRDRMPLFITPNVNEETVVKSRWNAWKKISGVFVVDKESKFLIIGNFYNDNRTQTVDFPGGRGGAYYYIDDVTVRRAKPMESLSPNPKRSIPPHPKTILEKAEIVSTTEIKLDSIDYKVGNTITLENIFFEFDKSALLPASKSELEKLVDIMTDYPHLSIEIGGHTDNIGSEAYNQKLSEARAKSVVDFLLDKKVNPIRVTYKGYGSVKPITSNATEEGQAINRRVEFTVMRN